MCNYFRKHVPNFAQKAKPMFCLIKKDVPFLWNDACEKSFNQLKEALITPPVLIYPNYAETFIITTDSSDTCVGSMLSQGEIPNDKPIMYFSKVLNNAQQRYSSVEKELMAIIFSIEAFRHFIYNRSFLIITDCQPVTYLLGGRHTNPRMIRWKILLSEQNFKIIHKKGSQNVVADALSRIRQEKLSNPEDIKINAVQTRRQIKDKTDEISNNENTSNNEIPINKNYFMEEKNNMLVNTEEYDQVIYIFGEINGYMHKKLQHKLKIQIDLVNVDWENDLYALDEKRTIAIMKPILRNKTQIETAWNLIQKIMTRTINEAHENIAINVEFDDAQSYFEFKMLLKKAFSTSHVEVTIFLNKVIEITDPILID